MLFTGKSPEWKVRHGAELHAQHTRDVHGGPRSVFSLELFVQVFFRLVHLIGRGVDWSLAGVQFVRVAAGSKPRLVLQQPLRSSWGVSSTANRVPASSGRLDASCQIQASTHTSVARR